MCYNISFRQPDVKKLQERYSKVTPPQPQANLTLPAYYFVSGFDHPALPVVTNKGIALTEWGLIPYWTKDADAAKKMQPQTLNAVGETVFEKPAFKDCIHKQRCLLPVNGFIEWRDMNKVKYPYYISVKSDELFSIGGVFSNWTDRSTGEMRTTFAVLTTAANPMVEKIHNLKKRMPLIIPRSDEQQWVDPGLSAERIESLIKPYDENDMHAYTISRHANNPKNDRNIPEILHEARYPELNVATLF